MKAFLKNIYELRRRHKLIDTELERLDQPGTTKATRIMGGHVPRRALIKFKKEHLQGYELIDANPMQTTKA